MWKNKNMFGTVYSSVNCNFEVEMGMKLCISISSFISLCWRNITCHLTKVTDITEAGFINYVHFRNFQIHNHQSLIIVSDLFESTAASSSLSATELNCKCFESPDLNVQRIISLINTTSDVNSVKKAVTLNKQCSRFNNT